MNNRQRNASHKANKAKARLIAEKDFNSYNKRKKARKSAGIRHIHPSAKSNMALATILALGYDLKD